MAAVLGFFIAHGTSMAVAFRLKRERDPERVRALLDLSGWATALPGATLAPLGFVAGIAAGFMATGGDRLGSGSPWRCSSRLGC